MTRPRPHFRRPDLIYRAMLRDEQDANPGDQLFDRLTRKVMEHLNETSISEWTDQEWGTYRTMLAQHSKNPLLSSQPEDQIGEMATEDLQRLMSSDDPSPF